MKHRKHDSLLTMIEIMSVFLLIIMLTGAICFSAGYLVGKAFERRNVELLINRYYDGDDLEYLNDLITTEKEDD